MTPHEKRFHHASAHKLDDPERAAWLPPTEILAALALAPGERVADVGAGTGYLAIPASRAVGPHGKVYAIDAQREMLALLAARRPVEAQIEPIEADASRIPLSASTVDAVMMTNVWHELDDRGATAAELARIAKPGARLAIVDWRADVESPPGPPREHRVDAEDARDVLAAHGWRDARASRIGKFSWIVTAVR